MSAFTRDDMERFAAEAWGSFGAAIVAEWAELNARFFAGALRPVPLVLTNAQPFGKRLAFCSYTPGFRRTITRHDTAIALGEPAIP